MPLNEAESIDNDGSHYHLAESEAYKKLYAYIRSTIIPECCVVKQSDLLDKIIQFMRTNDTVTEIKHSTKTHISRNLAKEFGTTIQTVSDDDGKVLIYPDSLTREMLVKENMALRKRIANLEKPTIGIEASCQVVAKQIHQDVMHLSQDQPWPPLPIQLDSYSSVPSSVKSLLSCLLPGTGEKEQ